ncbi:MAG TPA: PAS domain S-box protein, partial [Candidatus Lokiarchaeia archaeon]
MKKIDNIIKKKDYGKKILLIEDNANDIRSIQEMFNNFDNKWFEMIVKTTLSESIESIKENNFIIILLNPLLSGYQEFKALEILLKENLRMPIIILTEKDDQAVAIEAVKFGAQNYLNKKKMNSILLEKSILYAIERNQLKNELEELTKYLKFSEDRYKALIDNVPFPVFILNPECKIVNTNEKAIDLFEFSREELLDLNIFELIDNKSIDAGKEYFFKSIYDLQNSHKIETVVNTKTHKKLYIEIISTILKIEDTKFIISFFSNITERIMYEKNKEKFFVKLQQSSETNKGLYASLSHEFRTPLNAIMGFSQLLIEEYYGELNESQKEFINDILSSGAYLMNILETISVDISGIISNRDKDNIFNNSNKYVSDASNRIKISEINYKELFDDNLSGIILIDSSGFFLDCNEFVLNLFKFKKVDVIGKNIKEIAEFFKDSYVIILEFFNKFLRKENSEPIDTNFQRE